MKKKIEISYDNGAGEDMQYYLQQFKKEAMKKAEEIFGKAELADKDAPSSQDVEHFDMKEIYKTSNAKPEQDKEVVDTHMSAVLAQIKKEAQQIAADIFKTEWWMSFYD